MRTHSLWVLALVGVFVVWLTLPCLATTATSFETNREMKRMGM
jgi:hypothetical protein